MNARYELRVLTDKVYVINKDAKRASMFGRYLGRDVTSKLTTYADACIEANTVAVAESDWHVAHSLENLFNEIELLLRQIKQSDSYHTRPQPRGYDRSGVAFY